MGENCTFMVCLFSNYGNVNDIPICLNISSMWNFLKWDKQDELWGSVRKEKTTTMYDDTFGQMCHIALWKFHFGPSGPILYYDAQSLLITSTACEYSPQKIARFSASPPPFPFQTERQYKVRVFSNNIL